MDLHDYPDGVTHLLPPIHPGTVLAEELAARDLNAHRLALAIRVPANRISDIIRGKRPIAAETALRISRYLGTTAQFWIALQSQYDLALAQREHGARIEREVEPA
jgi:antitoxin HigA-1